MNVARGLLFVAGGILLVAVLSAIGWFVAWLDERLNGWGLPIIIGLMLVVAFFLMGAFSG